MNRRSFLSQVAAAGAYTAVANANETRKELVLSKRGCGRATGYAEANKIISHEGKVHVAWLDSEEGEGFLVRLRTLDQRSGTWGPTQTIGGAIDNHGGPALTIDQEGFLHIVYGPHHHPMRYRRSVRPNDSSEWTEEIRFGEKLTYPTLVCDPDGNLLLTCRRSHSDRPWVIELWKKPRKGDWKRVQSLARSRHPGYAHFQEGLIWGPDGKTLHMLSRFHELTDKKGYGRIQHVAYMQSPDRGKTWRRYDGKLISLPATADGGVDILANGGLDAGRDLRIGGMAITPGGIPITWYSVMEDGRGESYISRPDSKGNWQSASLRPFVPRRYEKWNLISPGGLASSAEGTLILVAQLYEPIPPDRSAWGHPKNEVCVMTSKDLGQTFDFELVTGPDPEVPNWLPNIERPTGFNLVSTHPGMIFTRGGKGNKNTDILANDVIWRPL